MTFVSTQLHFHGKEHSRQLKRPATTMLNDKATSSSPGYPTHYNVPNKRSQHLSSSTNIPCQRQTEALQYPPVPAPPLPVPTDSKQPPFYGHQLFAETISRFVIRVFGCSPYIPPTKSRVYPTLPEFIAYVVRKTSLNPSVPIIALIYLNRLALRHPERTAAHGHKLFFTAYLIAAKAVCEEGYNNKSWARVAMEMFTLQSVNAMEREMCSALEWELGVDSQVIMRFQSLLWKDYGVSREREEYPGPYPERFVTPQHIVSSGPFESNVSALVHGQDLKSKKILGKERLEKAKNSDEAVLEECSDDSAMVVDSIEIGGDSLNFDCTGKWLLDPLDHIKLRDQCFAYPSPTSW